MGTSPATIVATEKQSYLREVDIFRDNETGSDWTRTGTARSSLLAGKQLTLIIHGDEFWFVWAAFLPTTAIRQ